MKDQVLVGDFQVLEAGDPELMDDDEELPSPDEIALVAMQGLLAQGMEAGPAAGNAWLSAVPEYYKAREQFWTQIAPMFGWKR